jgi:hypothetical protein
MKLISLNYCTRFGCQHLTTFPVYIHPALGSTQSPIQWVPGALSPALKRSKRKAGHLPPSGAEVKNSGAKPPFPHPSIRRGTQLIKHVDSFTFIMTLHCVYDAHKRSP